MTNSAIAVFTGKSVDTIMEDGGTQSWKLDQRNARKYEYVVLCRNTHAEWASSDSLHGAAFIVGRNSEIVRSAENPDRWKILFSEYAELDQPDVWGGWRNPVKYSSLEELGIGVEDLDFQTMPDRYEVDAAKASNPIAMQSVPLTIPEAKKALALTFGVEPEAIEITIRG